MSDPVCTICNDDLFDGGELHIISACDHMYHSDCLRAWVGLSTSCPKCDGDNGIPIVAPSSSFLNNNGDGVRQVSKELEELKINNEEGSELRDQQLQWIIIALQQLKQSFEVLFSEAEPTDKTKAATTTNEQD